MNKPEAIQKGSAERRLKAAQMWRLRVEKRFLNLTETIRTEKPETFARLICDGVIGNQIPGSVHVLFAGWRERGNGENAETRRFRYLAELILDRIGGVLPDITAPYISLARWIEANAYFNLDHFAFNPYSVNFRNLNGTVDAHDLYVSHVRWAFFDSAAEALNYSAMLAARMLYRGIRLFELDVQTGEFHPVQWGDDDYVFLRQKGQREEVTTGYSLPDWATRYFVKSEQVKLHDTLFHLDYDLSAEEIDYRRSVLMPQCGSPTAITESEKAALNCAPTASNSLLDHVGWKEMEAAVDEIDNKLWEAASEFYQLDRSEENLVLLNSEAMLIIESANYGKVFTPRKYSAIASGFLAIGIARRMIENRKGIRFTDVIAIISSAAQAIGYVKALNNAPVEIAKTTSELLSEIAKKAVSQRADQLLKPGWLAHCKKVKDSGVEIKNINTLLNIEGYDPKIVTTVDAESLKSWAREVLGNEFRFKPGRDKKQLPTSR